MIPINQYFRNILALLLLAFLFIVALNGCNAFGENGYKPETQSLPVVTLDTCTLTTYQEFTSSLEGKVNVEVRPQVEGYLDKIFADEGAYVKAGQPLFQINSSIYTEQLNNAIASQQMAEANLAKAQVEVDRLTPLVQNNVVSGVQLKTAQSACEAAKASVAQAKAMVGNAKTNLGFTIIKAPVNGYMGRIPYKAGSLVGRNEPSPLTVLSDIDTVYAYFAISEVEFNQFKQRYPGTTLQDKIKALPPVSLILAGNIQYTETGKIELVEGQFDKNTGAISLRASFPNKNGLIRSGNTGKIRLPQLHHSALIVPIKSTFDLQDKIFVYLLGDSNKVKSAAIDTKENTTDYYIVNDGVRPGDKIVYTGLDRLHDGVAIHPYPLSMDSLLKANPL